MAVYYSDKEAYNVGKNQKIIIWLILASIAAYFIPFAPIVVSIFAIIFVYKLAEAQKLQPAWLWAFSQIIPLISLIFLLVLNGKATNILRAKGVRVGLMGANTEDLKKLLVQ